MLTLASTVRLQPGDTLKILLPSGKCLEVSESVDPDPGTTLIYSNGLDEEIGYHLGKRLLKPFDLS